MALDQGEERGWYSYLDMSTFFENSMFQDFLTKYFKSTGKVTVGNGSQGKVVFQSWFSVSAGFKFHPLF